VFLARSRLEKENGSRDRRVQINSSKQVCSVVDGDDDDVQLGWWVIATRESVDRVC